MQISNIRGQLAPSFILKCLKIPDRQNVLSKIWNRCLGKKVGDGQQAYIRKKILQDKEVESLKSALKKRRIVKWVIVALTLSISIAMPYLVISFMGAGASASVFYGLYVTSQSKALALSISIISSGVTYILTKKINRISERIYGYWSKEERENVCGHLKRCLSKDPSNLVETLDRKSLKIAIKKIKQVKQAFWEAGLLKSDIDSIFDPIKGELKLGLFKKQIEAFEEENRLNPFLETMRLNRIKNGITEQNLLSKRKELMILQILVLKRQIKKRGEGLFSSKRLKILYLINQLALLFGKRCWLAFSS